MEVRLILTAEIYGTPEEEIEKVAQCLDDNATPAEIAKYIHGVAEKHPLHKTAWMIEIGEATLSGEYRGDSSTDSISLLESDITELVMR